MTLIKKKQPSWLLSSSSSAASADSLHRALPAPVPRTASLPSLDSLSFVGLPGAHDPHQPRRAPASFSRTVYSRPSAEKRKPGPCRPAVQERPGVKGLSRHMLPAVRYSTIPLTPGLISPRCSHQGGEKNHRPVLPIYSPH